MVFSGVGQPAQRWRHPHRRGQWRAIIDVSIAGPAGSDRAALAQRAGFDVATRAARPGRRDRREADGRLARSTASSNKTAEVLIWRNTGIFRVISRRVIEELRLNETMPFSKGDPSSAFSDRTLRPRCRAAEEAIRHSSVPSCSGDALPASPRFCCGRMRRSAIAAPGALCSVMRAFEDWDGSE